MKKPKLAWSLDVDLEQKKGIYGEQLRVPFNKGIYLYLILF